MKLNIHNIVKILSDHTIEIVDENGCTQEVVDWVDYRSIADKILALGKPEPLAKNKQTERVCEHLNTEPMPTTKEMGNWKYCLDCETPFKRTNTKDASSR